MQHRAQPGTRDLRSQNCCNHQSGIELRADNPGVKGDRAFKSQEFAWSKSFAEQALHIGEGCRGIIVVAHEVVVISGPDLLCGRRRQIAVQHWRGFGSLQPAASGTL
jgi:hypothetical protein